MKNVTTLLFAAVVHCLVIPTVQAHEEDEHCKAIMASVAEAGFENRVDVSCDDARALLSADTYPDHPKMTGIVGTNEQVPVPAVDYASPVQLAPILGSTPQTRDAALGVAVNGVPIYDYTGGGEMSIADLAHHQAQHDTVQTQQLDICGGHAGRGDDYHYHATPTCMIEMMPNAGPAAIIGWAFDGFPIYGDSNPDGTAIKAGALDICNGQPDDLFGYRYHTSEDAPYIIQCLMGEVPDMDSLPRVPPMQPADGSRAPEAGFPPEGGVENLVFTEEPSGLRSMTYSHEGSDYYINYAPSDAENCYDYETRTVTNNGELYEQELCRTAADDRPEGSPAPEPRDGEGGVNGKAVAGDNNRATGSVRPPRAEDNGAEAGQEGQPPSDREPFVLTSSAMDDGASLPSEFACTRDGGEGLSPPVSWSGAPEGTDGYVVVMHHYPRGTYPGVNEPSHYWLLWGIPADVEGIVAGNPDGIGYEGANKDMRGVGYTPPCSPGNQVHTYTISVYAVDGPLDGLPSADDETVDWAKMMNALRGHVLSASSLSFTR